MTFVSLPSITDVFSQTTGASAWAKNAFDQFLPAMWWPIGTMVAAIILRWILTHTIQVMSWIKNHFASQKLNSDISLLDKEENILKNYSIGKKMLYNESADRQTIKLNRMLNNLTEEELTKL